MGVPTSGSSPGLISTQSYPPVSSGEAAHVKLAVVAVRLAKFKLVPMLSQSGFSSMKVICSCGRTVRLLFKVVPGLLLAYEIVTLEIGSFFQEYPALAYGLVAPD